VALGHYECGGCGASIDAGDRYCRHCGSKLEGGRE
jgi:predicted amidophosphoribosyltransferase